MNLTDTHAHLYWDSFKEDFDDMFRRAVDAGVSTIINVGVDVQKSQEAVDQAQNTKWPGSLQVYSTIGIHPHEAVECSINSDESIHKDITQLEQIYQSNPSKCIGIGECGLDFLFPSPVIPSASEESLDSSPSAQNESMNQDQIKDFQRKLFKAQIDLAKNLNLPLIVHCRDDRSQNSQNSEAWEECVEMTKNHFGIYHCFSGLPSTTNLILHSTKFLISFAANITYPKNEYLRDAAKIIPLDRIALETDSPFLAPQSNRGKRNEPANVLEVAKTIAGIKGINVEQIARQTTENVAKLFLLG